MKKKKKTGHVKLENIPMTVSELRASKMLLAGLRKQKIKDYQLHKQKMQDHLENMKAIINKLKG